MTRPKDKGSKRKAGRKSVFSPRKETILANFAETYSTAHLASRPEVALFLTKLANWCIARWGYSELLSLDVEGEDDDPTEVYDLKDSVEPADDDLSEAEAETRIAYFNDLRNKLGCFYRRKYLHGALSAKDIQPSTAESVLAYVAAKVPKKPTKSNYLNQYMKMHYKAVMKVEADRRLAAARAEYNGLSEVEKESKTPPVPVKIRTAVAREFWATESAEVKASVIEAAGNEHEESIIEWNGLKELPKTPAQHYHQINYAGVTLRPIADSIAKQMGCPVIILMPVVMPVGGKIEMISVHGTKPGSLASDKFPAKDPIGYAETEALVKKYGLTQYTAAEIAGRTFAPGDGPSATTTEGDEFGVDDDLFGNTPDGELLRMSPSPSPPTIPPTHIAAPATLASSSALNSAPQPSPSLAPPLTHPVLSARPPLSETQFSAPAIPPPSRQPSRSRSPKTSLPPTLSLSRPGNPLPPPISLPEEPTVSRPAASEESFIPRPVREVVDDLPPPTSTAPSPLTSTLPAPLPDDPTLLNSPPQGSAVASEESFTPWPIRDVEDDPPPPTPTAPSPLTGTPTAPLPDDPIFNQGSAASSGSFTPEPILGVVDDPPPLPPTAPSPLASTPLAPPSDPTLLNQGSAPSESLTPGSILEVEADPPPLPPTVPSLPTATQPPPLFTLPNPAPPSPTATGSIVNSKPNAHAHTTPTKCLSSPPAHAPHLGFVDLPADTQAIHDYLLNEPSENGLRPFGIQWVVCVREFVSFEMRSGFSDCGAKLANAPEEVQWWRKSHRPFKDQPPRKRTLDAFVADWVVWWAFLQPPDRIIGANGRYVNPKPEMDWSALGKSGANGFLLVMLTLTWWGMLRADDEWHRAVKDVTMVLRSLPKASSKPVSTTTHSSKRKGAPLSKSNDRAVNTPRPTKRMRVDSVPESTSVISPRRLRKRL